METTNKPDLTNVRGWCDVYYRGEYKTAIHSELSPYYFKTVTRVNYLTATLWLQIRNAKTKGRKGFMELSNKPNWLVMAKMFRRQQDVKMKELIDNT